MIHCIITTALLVLLAHAPATQVPEAQARYPAKLIKIVVGYGPGGRQPISLRDFPLVVSIKGDSKMTSIADLVTYTKASPKTANYAASATAFQLASELLKDRTGIFAKHIPY